MPASFNFDLSYGQLAIFASSLEKPFNDWTDKHVAQGFSWRPNSVSFRSLIDAGIHHVELNVQDRLGALHPEAVRVIEVPFESPKGGEVEIGSIADTVPISLPSGKFLLRCEFLAAQGKSPQQVRLTFASGETARYAVVLADPALSDFRDLETTAEPASG